MKRLAILATLTGLTALVTIAEAIAAPNAATDSPGLAAAWKAFDATIPRDPQAFATANAAAIAAAAQSLEARAAEHLTAAERALEQAAASPPAQSRVPPRFRRGPRGQEPVGRGPVATPSVTAALEPLLLAKQRVDGLFEKLLAIRGNFASLSPADQQRSALRNYLRAMSAVIDLSGRLRYVQFDAIRIAAANVAENPAERDRLVAMLTQYRSTIGATVMAELLFDPAGEPNEVAALKASDALKSKVLTLIATSEQSDLLGDLADYVLDETASPALLVQAAETIRVLGLPQDPRPGQDPTLPPVAITAKELREKLLAIPAKSLTPALQPRHAALIAWLDERMKSGVTGGHYALGTGDFAPGDWLLMRNPSPYNLFTDISPGLFTHVGVVAEEKGPDGITRIVLIDLPERGSQMPATTVDTFVKRTRHYLVLRHKDPEVARKIADAAAELIGAETQFDLNFRTGRVAELAKKPLKGQKIDTYCAGLLLLCALKTGHPREEFFPIAEFPAGGNSPENLKSFGMSMDDEFISPTGALFSNELKIVARREPMYDPRREVEEAVYDYFATQLVKQPIHVSADVFQSLRLKVAEASKSNPLLAQALASAANVNIETDLVSAAKAAAVVEILDQAAQSASAEFLAANYAMRAGSAEQMREAGLKPEQIAQVTKTQARHADLYRRLTNRQVSSRALRIELVNYYTAQGRRQLDERFFTGK